MHRYLLAAAIPLLAVLQPAPAAAALITQYVTGTVSGSDTVDTLGVFGPAGTDLKGKTVQIYLSYNTLAFNEEGCGAPSGSTCDVRLSKPAKRSETGNLMKFGTPQSVLIQIQVGSAGRSFAPFEQATFYVFNTPGSPGQLRLQSDDANDGPGLTASVNLYFASTTAFGSHLSPTNNPVNVGYIGAGNQTSFTIDGVPPGGTSIGSQTTTFTVGGHSQY